MGIPETGISKSVKERNVGGERKMGVGFPLAL
jgi:hypothetical protein